ncbi:hypothetical protein GDO78_019366 [Eleutherodactylus coqui]|uniref:Uncharacterized protein n=1 Tax=Eleutherodactylus coqui TaxID=57060 RepID=A0A8J6ECH7_ELECQ|nr:hypothetical protein GDO78_019366 [Eleutherodactylus coqui]
MPQSLWRSATNLNPLLEQTTVSRSISEGFAIFWKYSVLYLILEINQS